ncbi:uncharacterized protein BDR25DRAFT_93665 [Lindgomyces ingoldianus]|uniref:Uncharacterized protein n=1 Tax=Lindgomyces ingoldianus TaxID=673940 RepID=A0ACB6QFH5_9PLEO|nr:uncharacterized protein BDR25DRAFT_93665 [Lindgomyces ingoldianus]KAF2464886.1 hypothetical protein BDR25DRAFT_93665 [Lindgomyces ingoldianus]
MRTMSLYGELCELVGCAQPWNSRRVIFAPLFLVGEEHVEMVCRRRPGVRSKIGTSEPALRQRRYKRTAGSHSGGFYSQGCLAIVREWSCQAAVRCSRRPNLATLSPPTGCRAAGSLPRDYKSFVAECRAIGLTLLVLTRLWCPPEAARLFFWLKFGPLGCNPHAVAGGHPPILCNLYSPSPPN